MIVQGGVKRYRQAVENVTARHVQDCTSRRVGAKMMSPCDAKYYCNEVECCELCHAAVRNYELHTFVLRIKPVEYL